MLDDYPKTVVLTDGAHLTLRPAVAADEPVVTALLAGLAPAERGPAGGERLLAVLAFDGERAAALLALEERARAEAALRLVIDPAYRGRRLGTWMLLDAVHVAGGLGLERLLVEVSANAADYRAALRRLDFVEHERHGGTVVMTKTLHRGWPDF